MVEEVWSLSGERADVSRSRCLDLVQPAMMGACQAGGGRRAAGEAQRGRGVPVGAVRRRSVMGGARLRGVHTERRCTGVVDGAGCAGGEMSEDPLDDLGSVDAGDDAQRAATHTTVFDVDVEDALEALHPAQGWRRRMGFAGGSMSTVGDDVVAAFEVRGEHAVVSGEMGAGAGGTERARCASGTSRGGEAGDKVHRVEPDMSRPVVEGVLESIHDLPAVIDRKAFVRDCWAGDVAAPPGAGNETGSGEPPELRITGQSGAVLTRNRSSRHVVMRRLTLNTPPR